MPTAHPATCLQGFTVPAPGWGTSTVHSTPSSTPPSTLTSAKPSSRSSAADCGATLGCRSLQQPLGGGKGRDKPVSPQLGRASGVQQISHHSASLLGAEGLAGHTGHAISHLGCLHGGMMDLPSHSWNLSLQKAPSSCTAVLIRGQNLTSLIRTLDVFSQKPRVKIGQGNLEKEH